MIQHTKFLTALMIGLSMHVSAPFVVAFNSGSTGADGAFSPTVNTELQVPASGVFNFTTVNIPSGVLVTFKPNAANTPVTILASGDVTISGVVSVNGGSAGAGGGGTGGPGGFRGGAGSGTGTGGTGLGPGGGSGGVSPYFIGDGGSYATSPTGNPSLIYGTNLLLPLLGGSGGGGGGAYNGQ